MNTYDAMHAAAEFIADHPETYEFMHGCVPYHENGSACMLARLGYYLNEPAGTPCEPICANRLGIEAGAFYHRIEFLTGSSRRNDPLGAAQGLRQYAEAYLDPKTGIPKQVREWFHVERAEV